MNRFDLLVVGAGPAGSALAALAASAGARTLLVERARFPREKVCGEFVAAGGCAVLERLGVMRGLLGAGATRMDRCRITEPHGAAVAPRLSRSDPGADRALGVSRSLLDLALLEHAAACGAQVRQGWEAAAPVIEDGRVVGLRARHRSDAPRARLVVAADGRRSMLARRLHPRPGDPRQTGPDSWFGLKSHFSVGPRSSRRAVELHLFEGGYAGIAPVEAGRLNLCLMATVRTLRHCGGSPDRLLDRRARRNPALDRTLAGASRASGWSSVGPLRFATRCPTAAGTLFVGDAAGTIDPFCGAGISHALRAAEIALPFALEAIDRGGLDRAAAQHYARAWYAAFAPLTHRARWLGRLFERPRLARPVLLLLGGAARGALPRLVAATRAGGA